MVNFLVDVGNTDTCAGIAQDYKIVADTRAVSSVPADVFLSGGPKFIPDRAIISSVVAEKTQEWTWAIRRRWGIDAIVLTSDCVSGILNFNVEDPNKVGADRIADAVGAVLEYRAPCIVADFGTATNIEYIDENKTFCGGIIATGLWSGMKSLAQFASALSDVRLEVPKQVVGRSTETAVQSGLVYGEAARIDGLVAMIKAQVNKDIVGDIKVVATGGYSRLVGPLCSSVDFIDSLLTLKGLNFILNHID